MTSIAELAIAELNKDLEWREQELAIMRKELVSTTPGSVQERVLLRSNLAMIYAHYEGFCKFALEQYIDSLEKLRVPRRLLKLPLAAYSLRSFYQDLSKKKDRAEFFTLFLSDLQNHLNKDAEYERPQQIANLWPDLLIRWMSTLNLKSKCVSDEHTRLESLVNTRNQIAHGKKLTISNRTELERYAHAATLAMHQVAVEIADALESRSYLSPHAVSTTLSHGT